MDTTKLGDRLKLDRPIDLSLSGVPWGGQARVFLGILNRGDHLETVAVKLMRSGENGFLESFKRELRILSVLNPNLPQLTPVIDCGIINFSSKVIINDNIVDINQIAGDVQHYGSDKLMMLHDWLTNNEIKNGVPFIAIQMRDNLEMNLEEIIKDNSIDLLPIPDVLFIATQAMEILLEAHKNDIIYADSKPIHFYISFENNGRLDFKVIDWNASVILDELGIQDKPSAKQKDLKELVANILFPLFTGRQLFNSSGSDGRNQEDVIKHLDTKYQAINWKNIDDGRLDDEIKILLTKTVVEEKITSPEEFQAEIQKLRQKWRCDETGTLRAIQYLHQAYNNLEQGCLLLEATIEYLYESGNAPNGREEVQQIYYKIFDIKNALKPTKLRQKYQK